MTGRSCGDLRSVRGRRLENRARQRVETVARGAWCEGGSGDPRPTTPEGTTDGGLDEHVTNETNSAENVSLSQPTGEIIVTTNPGVGPALDKPENKPNGEVRPTAVGVADSRGDRGSTGGRSPTQHPAQAPAAVCRGEKKKVKRDGGQERKALRSSSVGCGRI